MGECRLLLFLAISSFTKPMVLEILTLESMGKPKMWNISKTANRRTKRAKIWESGFLSTHMEVSFDVRFLEFDLGSLGVFCTISNFTMLPSQFSSDSSKLYTKYPSHTDYYFLGAIC